ncbi:MAG TPA: lipopolysaccharide biosynthesis protein [Dongiaceae bacterium]
MSTIKGRIFRASVWISVSRGAVNLLMALSTIVLARLLLPTDFGLVALGTSMLVVLQAFTELSLAQALIHTREPTRDHYNTAWTLNTARGLLIGLGFALAGPFAASVYHEPRLENIMLALGVNAALGGLKNPRMVMLQKQLNFHQEAIRTISAMLLQVAVSIAVAVAFRSYWALVAGIMAGTVSTVILSYTLVPFRPSPGWKHLRELWSFSVWMSLGQIVNTLNYRFDQLLVGSYVGRAELGLYTVGSRLSVIPGQEIIRPLTNTLFPAFRLTADDPVRLRRAYQRVQAVVTAVALPASVGFALVADPVVRIALGEKWLGAIPVIQLMAAIYSIDTFGSLVTPLAMAKGQTRLLFIRNVQKFAIRVPMIVAGMLLGGFMGVLYSRMLAGAVTVGIDMTMVKRVAGVSVPDQFRANLRAIVSSMAMVSLVLLFQHLAPFADDKEGLYMRLGSTVLLGAFVYLGTSWLLWRIAGCPDGPETEAIGASIKALKAVRSKFIGARDRSVAG